MSEDAQDLERKVKDAIKDYVMPNEHLLAMQRIHEEFTGEKEEFNRWDEVTEVYSELEWNKERVTEFLSICKRVVDANSGSLSESYFRLHNVEDIDDLLSEFSQREYTPEAKGKAKEGFRYTQKGSRIDGKYIYVDINTEVTFSGEIEYMLSEGSIGFTVDFRNQLLIINSSSVVDVQKTKSIFKKYMSAGLSVYYPVVEYSEKMTERYSSMIERISDELTIREITAVNLHTPQGEGSSDELNTISEIEFQGGIAPEIGIRSSSEIAEKLDQGWYIKQLKVKVLEEGELVNVTIGVSEMMNYSKVENYRSRESGNLVQQQVREAFTECFRLEY